MSGSYCPTIHGFNDLFQYAKGFPEKSSILISGPPGAGKSIFALSILRNLVLQTKDRRLYYLSTEASAQRLLRKFAEMSWFTAEDTNFTVPTDGHAVAGARITFGFVPEQQLQRPVRDSEEVLNLAFNQIRRQRQHFASDEQIFLLVDSMTSLLKDCADEGERRRQTHEFLERLEPAFGDNLKLALLISEQGSVRSQTIPTEEYAVDFVLHLFLEETGSGRRLRRLEATKSQGAYMKLGVHSWSILAPAGVESVLAVRAMREDVVNAANQLYSTGQRTVTVKQGRTRQGNSPEPTLTFGTIIVFPRPQPRPIGSAQNR